VYWDGNGTLIRTFAAYDNDAADVFCDVIDVNRSGERQEARCRLDQTGLFASTC